MPLAPGNPRSRLSGILKGTPVTRLFSQNLMHECTFHIKFIMPLCASRTGWHVDTFAHSRNSSLVYDTSSSELKSKADSNALFQMIYPGLFRVNRHFAVSMFWPFYCWTGEKRQSPVPNRDPQDNELTYWAQFHHIWWKIAKPLDIADVLCWRCVPKHSLHRGPRSRRTRWKLSLVGLSMSPVYLCLHIIKKNLVLLFFSFFFLVGYWTQASVCLSVSYIPQPQVSPMIAQH